MGRATGDPGDRLREETRFGAYSVRLKDVNGLNKSLRHALGLTDSDMYLEVHVPDSVEGVPSAVLGAFKQGALQLADFPNQRTLDSKCLLGVTHQNVAMPARRFLNFRVMPGIPEDVVERPGLLVEESVSDDPHSRNMLRHHVQDRQCATDLLGVRHLPRRHVRLCHTIAQPGSRTAATPAAASSQRLAP